MKERREKALQNAKDRDAEKVNTQAALQAHIRASKASKDNQDIKMTDDFLMEKLNIQAKLRHHQNIELYIQNLYQVTPFQAVKPLQRYMVISQIQVI